MPTTSLKFQHELLRTGVLEDALSALNATMETGEGFDADEVHAYLKVMAGGKKTDKPKPRAWRTCAIRHQREAGY